jgi:hypothetical protein
MYREPFSTGIAGFSPIELRGICEPKSRGDNGIKDLRTLGCPDWLFQKVIERRAKSFGLKPGFGPRPASDEITDDQRRAASARTAALVDADKVRAEVWNSNDRF